VLNWIWLALVLGSIAYAGFTDRIGDVTLAMFEGAKTAVTVVIGLVGTMCFMLGVMRAAFDAGLRDLIARWIAPVVRRLFPEIPPEHPAMSAMVMNMASNLLGLGNAATPFGVKAMKELATLNVHPGAASNAMVLFLAINTSAITLMPPTGTMAVRAAAGSGAPDAIWVPTLLATTCSTLVAVTVALLLARLPVFQHRPCPAGPLPGFGGDGDDAAPSEEPTAPERPGAGARAFVLLAGAALAVAFGVSALGLVQEHGAGALLRELPQQWAFPLLIAGLLLYAVNGGVDVYASVIAGAREGLEVSLRIVPYLVAILAAVAMLRSSGALDAGIALVQPVTQAFSVPAEVLPMALLRPLSGSGAFAVMAETLETHGPDTLIGMMTSTLQGSTETTFYVLAVYFGAAGIRDTRHTLPACLSGDVAGFVGAVAACLFFFR